MVSAFVIIASASALAFYLAGVCAQHKNGKRWRGWRTASFTTGSILLIAAFTPPVTAFAHHDLRGHMLQHLLLGMMAPLGLVMGAPVTLLLREIPQHLTTTLLRVLRHQVTRFISHPVTALVLNIGGMYLLYFTPLYAISLHNSGVHFWVHLHFILAGCLFTWSIAGPDPAPQRPSCRFRLGVLFIAMGAHAVLAKAMYAYGWPRGTDATAAEVQAAAQWMYYGGDLAEVILLVGLLTKYFNRRRRAGQAALPLVQGKG